MAVIFPAGIYTEGQGLFDSMKYARMIEARKKAKQEAFAKYNDKLLGSINPAGVRDVDYPYITKDIENLQRYGIQNKTDIAKGGESRLQFERMVRDVSQRIDQSKNAGKFQMEMAQMVLDKKIDPRDDDMKIAEKMQFSIYDPRFYKEHYLSQAQGLPEYSQNTGTMWSKEDLTPAIPVLKPEEKTKYFDFGIKDKKPQYNPNIPLVTVGNQKLATYTYTEKDLKDGAARVAAEVRLDPIDFEGRRLKKTYESHMDDKSWMTSRDPIFQKYFNRPINTIADAAAADFLFDKENVKEQKPQTIPRPRVGRAGGKGTEKIDESLYYLSDEVAKDVGQMLSVKKAGEKDWTQMTVVFTKDVDPERMDIILNRTKGIGGIKPAKIVLPNGKTEMGYYVDPVTGDWYGDQNKKAASREAVKDRYIRVAAPTKTKAELGTKAAEKITPTQPTRSKVVVPPRTGVPKGKGSGKPIF